VYPRQEAVKLWVLAASNAVLKVALRAAFSAAPPRLVVPSRNSTIPLMVLGAFAFWPGDETVAVNRTVWLDTTCIDEAISAVLAG